MARPGTRTVLIVGALLLAALAIRIAEVQRTAYRPINDAGSYLSLASEIAHIGDYPTSSRPGTGAGGTRGPSAYFAPGFSYFLAAVDLIDGNTSRRDGAVQPARLSQAVLGGVTVALVGLVALEAFGPLVGLIALALAAVYPVFIELSGTLVAENLMTALILAALYAGLRARRARRHPYAWTAAAGLLTGLATLTHENAAVIAVPLVALVWTARPRLSLRGLAAPALLVVVGILTILPWTVRNAIELHRFIPVTDETGVTLVGTYNAASAANPVVPYKWRLYFGIPGERSLTRRSGQMTEAELGSRLESQALRYISRHPLAPLAVAYHNSRRLLELEGSFAWKASAAAIDLPIATARIGVVGFWALCLLAIAGAFTRAARVAPRWLWAAPILLWLSVVFVNAETPRFREPVDPFFILLGACAIATAARRARRLVRARGAGEDGRTVPVRAAEPVHMVERLP